MKSQMRGPSQRDSPTPYHRVLDSTELTIFADNAGLDCAASDKFDEAGNDPGLREVNSFTSLMSLGQYLRLVQLDPKGAALAPPTTPVRVG